MAKHLTDLSADVERDLIKRAQGGDSEALTTLLEHARPVVAAQARRIPGVGEFDLDDLIQEGLLEVVQVIESYEDHGRLVTAIHLSVRRVVMEAAASITGTFRVPDRTLRRYFSHVRAADGDYAAARRMAAADPDFSAETFDAVRESINGCEMLDSDSTGEEEHSSAVVDRLFLDDALGRLPERERTVLALHVGLDGDGPHPDNVIAQRLGIDRTRVVRIRQAALGRLRELALA